MKTSWICSLLNSNDLAKTWKREMLGVEALTGSRGLPCYVKADRLSFRGGRPALSWRSVYAGSIKSTTGRTLENPSTIDGTGGCTVERL
jgi:hypothetical protein